MKALPEFADHPWSLDEHPPRYRAHVFNVVDGDTFDCVVDLGFGDYRVIRVRVLGMNSAEMHAKDPGERVKAQAAKAAATDRLQGKPIVLETQKDEQTFDRWLARVWYWPEAASLQRFDELMIRDGFAVPYLG